MQTEKKDLLDSTIEKTGLYTQLMKFAEDKDKDKPLNVFTHHFYNWNKENVMLFVYLCKHFVTSEKDLWFVVDNLSVIPYLNQKEKKIVFSTFKVGDVVETLNSIETDRILFSVYVSKVFHVEEDTLLSKFLDNFDKSTLDLFGKETGADAFVAFVKKSEAERESRQMAHEIERAKREEEYKKQQEKQEKEKQAAHERRVKQADKRLKTIADILNKGGVIHFGKMERKGEEVKEDIRILPDGLKNDAWHALYSALVNAQYNIETRDRLEMFEFLLSCIATKHHRFLKKDAIIKMAEEALGIKKDELDPTKYGKDRKSIARYRQVFEIMATYPNIFASINFPKYLRGMNVFAYDNEVQRKRKAFSLKLGNGLLHSLIWKDTKLRKRIEEKISDKKYPAR